MTLLNLLAHDHHYHSPPHQVALELVPTVVAQLAASTLSVYIGPARSLARPTPLKTRGTISMTATSP